MKSYQKYVSIILALLTFFSVFTLFVSAQDECSHSWGSKTKVSATCTTPAYSTKFCTKCGVENIGARVYKGIAVGHKWGEWKNIESADMQYPGIAEHTCSVCGRVERTEYSYNRGFGRFMLFSVSPKLTYFMDYLQRWLVHVLSGESIAVTAF